MHINNSSFALKSNLSSLKTKVYKLDIIKLKSLPTNLSNLKSRVDKLDIGKLVPNPVDLSSLSNVVKNEVVKKTEYKTKIKNTKNKVLDITNLSTKTLLNTKIDEVKTEIPSISSLATTSTLTAIENKKLNVSNLVKKLTMTQKLMKLK